MYEKEKIMKKLKLFLVCTVISVIGVFGLTAASAMGVTNRELVMVTPIRQPPETTIPQQAVSTMVLME